VQNPDPTDARGLVDKMEDDIVDVDALAAEETEEPPVGDWSPPVPGTPEPPD
jgi:hypothetical protein